MSGIQGLLLHFRASMRASAAAACLAVAGAAVPAAPAQSEPVEAHWQALADEDYDKACAAARVLAARGDEAVAFLQGRLKPVSADADRIARLIADLGSERYPVRAAATAELTRLGPAAEPALRRALAQTKDVEVRRGIQSLLAATAKRLHETPARRRALWAVDVLEAVDTPRAHALLKTLAGGDAQAELTRRAAAAIQRIAGLDAAIKDPPKAILEMRLLPSPPGLGLPQPHLKEDEFQSYLKGLTETGPQPKSGKRPKFCWLAVDCVLPTTPFAATYKGQRHVLLAGQWPHALSSTSDLDLSVWELVEVLPAKDERGLPAVDFHLSPRCTYTPDFLTTAHKGAYLAFAVGGRVISVIRVKEKMSAKAQLRGLFSQRRARAIAAALKAGMAPVDTLVMASAKGNLDEVKKLLAGWPDLIHHRAGHMVFKDDQALHAAVRSRQSEMVEFLLERGAEINARGSRGRTPLQIAVGRGKVEMVRLLVKRGADLEVEDERGFGPLHTAVGAGNKELTELLIAAGADVNAKGKTGLTPLTVALLSWLHARKTNPCVELLVTKGAKRDVFAAAALGKLDEVKAFLAADPKAAKATVMGRITPLHAAVLGGHKLVAELLLDRGADINAGAGLGNWAAPLTLAAGCGHRDLVKLLLDRGADVNALDADGGKPIHSAAYQGHKEIVAILLDRGAKLDDEAEGGDTPLVMAARGGHAGLVEFLISRGADAKAPAKDGRTALHDVARDSVAPGGIGTTPAGRAKLREVAALLIAKGADVNARHRKNAPLHLAVESHFSKRADTELIRLFIKSGADVNAKNGRRRTALHMAAEAGDAPAAKVLLAAGADPFIEDDPNSVFGVRPVDLAKRHPDRKEMIALLEAHMAPRLKATKKEIEADAGEFLLAVAGGDDRTAKALTHDNPHSAKGIWTKWIKELRKEYAGQSDRLTSIVGSTTRAGWAEVVLQRPAGDAHKHLVLLLLKSPDGRWRVLETSKTSTDLKQALGQRIRYALSQYSEFRKKVFAPAKQDGP